MKSTSNVNSRFKDGRHDQGKLLSATIAFRLAVYSGIEREAHGNILSTKYLQLIPVTLYSKHTCRMLSVLTMSDSKVQLTCTTPPNPAYRRIDDTYLHGHGR